VRESANGTAYDRLPKRTSARKCRAPEHYPFQFASVMNSASNSLDVEPRVAVDGHG
jgi:hypothetical protein